MSHQEQESIPAKIASQAYEFGVNINTAPAAPIGGIFAALARMPVGAFTGGLVYDGSVGQVESTGKGGGHH